MDWRQMRTWILALTTLVAPACGLNDPAEHAVVVITTDGTHGPSSTNSNDPTAPSDTTSDTTGDTTDDPQTDPIDEMTTDPPAPKLEPGLFAFGGSGIEEGYNVAALADGSLFVVGTFSGELSMGDARATADNTDLFAMRLNPQMQVEWLQTWGSDDTDYTQRITTDDAGDLYVACSYSADITIAGKTHEFAGDLDALLVKLDGETGDVRWATSYGGPSYDGLRDLAAWDGKLWVAGYVGSELTLGQTAIGSHYHDTFVATVDPSTGNFGDVVSFATYESNEPTAIAIDAAKRRVLVTGTFVDSIQFGDTMLEGEDSTDVYVVALDEHLDVLWATAFTGYYPDTPSALVVDERSDVFVFGSFSAYIGAGGQYLETGAIGYETDAFVFKLDAAGRLGWGVSAGVGAGYDNVAGAAVHGDELVMTGALTDGWAMGIDRTTGDTRWMRSFASPGYAVARSLAIVDDRIVMTGVFEQSLSYGGTSVQSAGYYDAFVWVDELE